jgi:hypothetical protein
MMIVEPTIPFAIPKIIFAYVPAPPPLEAWALLLEEIGAMTRNKLMMTAKIFFIGLF